MAQNGQSEFFSEFFSVDFILIAELAVGAKEVGVE